MRLFSIQPRFVYDVLCREGQFLSQPAKAGDDWICTDSPSVQFAYDWLSSEMVSRGLPRPNGDVYPFWAWFQYMGPEKPKPDLRYSDIKGCAADGPQVLLSLDIPDDHVLLHDYHAWHYPLNYWYFATQRESSRFERRCKAAGCHLYRDMPLANDALHAELQQSWQSIFDLPRCRRQLLTRAAEQAVQATFWELNACHVLAVVEFGHGIRRRKLPLPSSRERTSRGVEEASAGNAAA